jgi:DNA invertase Pin-like site-specific DNA recombinase
MSQTSAGPIFAAQKILGRHHERLAVVYVRQSSLYQVQHNHESTQIQYGLVSTAERLGWPRERTLVIDDDQGISGASSEGRSGFQRLLSEVALDHVGLILGVEMSRLARSCKDWYQLLEICALFGTLICDLDGLYDPSSYNDRLLLGLKGTMSEAELHILQQRLHQGALQKARRGELVSLVPTGYVRRPSGEVSLDPDEQARAVVRVVFEQFERHGSLGAVLRYLLDHCLQLPVRANSGPDRGTLQWRQPSKSALRNMLRHPMYAGAYAYGRSCLDQQRRPAKTRRRGLPPDQWQVLLRDRYPAYITWQQYERNLAQLTENRSQGRSKGAIRSGHALLTGLVVCGRCGARMLTHHSGKSIQPRYSCCSARTSYGQSECQSLTARAVDDEVVRLALLALAPSALEVSLQVAADWQKEREQADAQWQYRLQRASYEADRARRQYDAVEPENRLVCRTLEAAWEQKLRAYRELQEEHERFLQGQPKLLTAAEQEAIRRLAADLPALWHAATTTAADRKGILRQILDKVVLQIEGKSEWVEARLHWAGGHQTYTRFRRPVASLTQLHDWPQIRKRMLALKTKGNSSQEIADHLNREGRTSPHHKAFTAATVRAALSRYGLTEGRHGAANEQRVLAEDEWLVPDLAKALGVRQQLVYSWIRTGRLPARQVDGLQGDWIVRADAATLESLQTASDHCSPSRTGPQAIDKPSDEGRPAHV